MFRRRVPSDPLGHLPDPSRPGELLVFDFLGRLPSGPRGERYIFVIVDYLTRWCSLGLSPKADSQTVITGLELWTTHYGRPARLLCDPASYHKSRCLRQWCMAKNIQLVHTAPGSHKSTGLVERLNQTLIGRIRRILAEGRHHSWVDTLPEALHAVRTTPNSITRMTPLALWRAGPPEWSKALQNMATARRLANSRLKLVATHYQVGDLVWVWDSERAKQLDRKFDPFWTGPWAIFGSWDIVFFAQTHSST